MATILAHIKVAAGNEREFEAVIRPLYEATHRLEPDCRRYEYWRGAEPGTYYCLLSFRDFRAFMTHQASEHHEAPDFPRLIELGNILRLEQLGLGQLLVLLHKGEEPKSVFAAEQQNDDKQNPE